MMSQTFNKKYVARVTCKWINKSVRKQANKQESKWVNEQLNKPASKQVSNQVFYWHKKRSKLHYCDCSLQAYCKHTQSNIRQLKKMLTFV